MEFVLLTTHMLFHKKLAIIGLLCLVASACISQAELEPEEGIVVYAVQHTPTDYYRVNRISFSRVHIPEKELLPFTLPIQEKWGWVSPTEYYSPPCPTWTKDASLVAFNDGKNITIYNFGESDIQTVSLDFKLIRL